MINKIMKLTVLLVLGFAWKGMMAQGGYDFVLRQIEEHNSTLAALRQQMEAQKIGNRTGLTPENPEVEFNYLWGSPTDIGNRYDLRVTQSFDFPTAYALRNKIAGLQNEGVDLVYKGEKMGILLHAQQICVEIVYHNALAAEHAKRLQNAVGIAEKYRVMLEKGEVNILEHNKAQLNLSVVQAEVEHIEAERAALLMELKLLNGGNEIAFPLDIFPAGRLPAHFDEWYAEAESQSPLLQYVRGQIEIDQQQVKLNRALGLPTFTAGYMSENVVGESFRGITVGISIPLYANKNRVKEAKAQVKASEMAYEDAKIQFYNRLKSQYHKAFALQQSAQKVRKSLSMYSNESLLKKALDAGELSLLNYLLEMEYYYDAFDKALESERDYELALSELNYPLLL